VIVSLPYLTHENASAIILTGKGQDFSSHSLFGFDLLQRRKVGSTVQILAYEEDALTFWALQNKLPLILHALQDSSPLSQCDVFFRPSIGRGGSERSAQFGEFAFILLTENCVYLGESKWDKSSEKIVDGVLTLREEQQLRHWMFKFCIEEWAYGGYANWHEFVEVAGPNLQRKGITKPLDPVNGLLASNLRTVLGVIKQHYSARPDVRNVLLYFHDRMLNTQLPRQAGKDFLVVSIDYKDGLLGNFVKINC
jgi:hypothetical protein